MTTNESLWKQIDTLTEMVGPTTGKNGLVDSLVKEYPSLPSAAQRDLQLLLQSLFSTLPLIAKLTKGPDAGVYTPSAQAPAAPPKKPPRMPYMT
jgi:hypothetical protein